MTQTHISWISYHDEALSRGYWDQGLLEEIFNAGDYVDHTNFEWLNDYNPGEVGSIIVINGRMHFEEEDVTRLNNDLSLLKWVILIVTGDEESVFDQALVKHPLMKYWIQLPRMNKHNDVFRIPNGYRPTTREELKDVEPGTKRSIDWMFAGQVTHTRREEMASVVKTPEMEVMNNRFFTSLEFGREVLPYHDYMLALSETKFALCPSGPESPDSFRVWEALEAGAIPIVDAWSTNNTDDGFWPYLLGEMMPIPVVRYWTDLPELVEVLRRDYPRNANRIFAWWQLLKRNIRVELEDSVAAWQN